MEIQHPVRSLNHSAAFHKLTHRQSLFLIFFDISQEYHWDAFARASARSAYVGVFSVVVLRIPVCAEALNCLVPIFELDGVATSRSGYPVKIQFVFVQQWLPRKLGAGGSMLAFQRDCNVVCARRIFDPACVKRMNAGNTKDVIE